MLWFLKDKASRIERIVGEHQLFSQGLKELQDWLCEAQRVLNTCVSSTIDKSTLEDRMLQLEVRREMIGPDPFKNKPQLCFKSILQCFVFLGSVNKHHAILDLRYLSIFVLCVQALLAARQEREIQLKMLLTRGEAVQRNTSAEGVPVIRKQIQDLKDSWDSLLSSCIRCKRWSSSSLSSG